MAKQTINQGTAPTGAGGDTFRTGSAKLQANDNEIYNYLGDGTNLNKLGTAAFKNTGTQAGDVMAVGAFGLGGDIVVIGGAGSCLEELEAIGEATKFVYSTSAYGGKPSGQYSLGINLCSFGDQIFVAFDVAAKKSGMVCKTSRGTISAATFYTTANATVDSNGFIKAASPIVKLFSEKIELNDEAQKQEIVFEKLGTGNYLIKGSTGFAQEGWYIETPKDANGNVLFSVIYTKLENGDISVKTYKKKFDFETVSIVDDLDNPVDIAENRWIDIRLQELPQPEIEVTESIAPPEFQPTGLAQAVATVMESYHDTEQ